MNLKKMLSDDYFNPSRDVSRHCDKCQYFGGWVPIGVGEQIMHDVHGECLNPKLARTIAEPKHGCSFWVGKQDSTQVS